MSACRSCFAEIIWCSTWKGKLIPVDAEPTANGNLVMRQQDFGPPVVVQYHTKMGPSVRYTSHFATCPSSARWRRKRSK